MLLQIRKLIKKPITLCCHSTFAAPTQKLYSEPIIYA